MEYMHPVGKHKELGYVAAVMDCCVVSLGRSPEEVGNARKQLRIEQTVNTLGQFYPDRYVNLTPEEYKEYFG